MASRARVVLLLTFALALCPAADGKILGVFQGKIIKASSVCDAKRYLYVQGKSGFVRKVNVSHATVEYDDDFPAGGRSKHPSDALQVATLVRITAEQKNQSWLATEVLILSPERDGTTPIRDSVAALEIK
jgi:hypothetical protein